MGRNAAAFVAGLLLTPMLASPFEWLVHRYVYHRQVVPGLGRIYHIHHHWHHRVFFPTWRYGRSRERVDHRAQPARESLR